MTPDPGTVRGRAAASAPPGTRIYAIGDSHGCTAHLRALHAAILEDCRGAAGNIERQILVYLGDYIDRGPDSRGLLDILIGEPLPGFERVFLMGNHDIMLRRLIDEGAPPPSWPMNGAAETLASYGVDPRVWGRGPAAVYEGVMSRLPESHAKFLHALKYCHVEGDYLFVHAGIRPGVGLENQSPQDMMWIREPFLDSEADHGKVVVHGHTPVEAPEVRANRIGIDTGAVYGGVLTALVLEGTARRFLFAG